MLLRALVLLQGLLCLENLGARIALEVSLDGDRELGVLKNDLFLLEKLLGDRLKLSHLTLRVVDMELGASMQLEARHISERESACAANNLLRPRLHLTVRRVVGLDNRTFTGRVNHH